MEVSLANDVDDGEYLCTLFPTALAYRTKNLIIKTNIIVAYDDVDWESENEMEGLFYLHVNIHELSH